MLSQLNKKAWAIRKRAAKRLNCKVMQVSWKECLRMAKEGCVTYLDKVARKYSGCKSFKSLLDIHRNYDPTIFISMKEDYLILANAFDYYMKAFGKPNRAYRC